MPRPGWNRTIATWRPRCTGCACSSKPGLRTTARAQSDGTRNYPTFGLALSVFDDPSWDALSPHRPLRDARLLEISQPSGSALTASPLRADERIVNFLKGLNEMDERLSHLLQPL